MTLVPLMRAAHPKPTTERKAAESTHMRLLGELNHRVKNSLATIQSIANLTLRRYDTPAAFVPAFSGRVQALSRAHDVLTANTWKGADLATLVHQQLSLEGMRDGRVAFKGPPATLDPQPALALALVLHELGTNARTHGALAVPDGLVRLSWVTDETISPTGLQLLWQEVDGPPVEPPTRRGFGSQFIEHSLRALGGAAEIAFEPSGVKCAIKVPLTSAEPRKVGAI